jgi:hypothetical protein
MAIGNLALRFVLELVGVGALAYWGSQQPLPGFARLALALAAPAALIVVWALVVAPKTANGLNQVQKDAIGTVLLLAAAGVLALAGHPSAASAFAAVVVVNWMLLVHFGERPMELVR